MDIFLQILDGKWLDDEDGSLVYWYSQKCIALRYLFRVNGDLLVYRCTPSTGPTQEDPVFFLCFRGMVAGPFKRGKLARVGAKRGKLLT